MLLRGTARRRALRALGGIGSAEPAVGTTSAHPVGGLGALGGLVGPSSTQRRAGKVRCPVAVLLGPAKRTHSVASKVARSYHPLRRKTRPTLLKTHSIGAKISIGAIRTDPGLSKVTVLNLIVTRTTVGSTRIIVDSITVIERGTQRRLGARIASAIENPVALHAFPLRSRAIR